MQMPPSSLSPSASGMIWFHTPEEYLSEWRPRITFSAFTERTGEGGKRCPQCGNSNHLAKIGRYRTKQESRYSHWHCKRWSCGHKWPMVYEDITYVSTQEEWVFACLKVRGYSTPHWMERQFPSSGLKLKPMMALGLINAQSGDASTAHTGEALIALGAYKQYQSAQQKEAAMQADEARFQAEYERAWAMAVEHFEGPRRAQEAQRAQAAAEDQDDARLIKLARMMAKEMFDEADRRRAPDPSPPAPKMLTDQEWNDRLHRTT